MHFVVDKDTETGEHAGARGTFQIACLSIEGSMPTASATTYSRANGDFLVLGDPVRQFHFPVQLRKIPCSTA